MFDRPPLSYVPMVPAFAGVVVGVCLFPLMTYMAVVALGVAAAIFGVVLLSMRHRWSGRFLLFLSSGMLTAFIHCPVSTPDDVIDNDNYVLSGVVMESADINSGRQVDVMSVDGFPVRLYVKGEADIYAGDSVRMKVRMSRPDSCRWPRQFDYPAYLARKGVEVVGYVMADSVYVEGSAGGVRGTFMRVRKYMSDALCRSKLNDGSTRFIIAALLGDSSSLLPDDRSRFTAAGIAHLLALSGTHVAVVSMLLGFVLFPLYLFGQRLMMLVLSVVVLWCYALLTGMSPSVSRAVIMVTVVAGAYLMRRRHTAFNSLIAAAVVIVLFDPSALKSVGFQLSFAAVASILLIYNLLIVRISDMAGTRRWWMPIVSAIVVTLAATMATAPVAVRNFGVFPVYFLLANMPAMVLIMPMLAGGIVVIVLELTGLPSGQVCGIVNGIYACLDGVVSFVGGLPGHLITGIMISDAVFVAWIMLLVALVVLLWQPRRRVSWIVLSVALVMLACSVVWQSLSGEDDPEEELFLVNDSRYAGLLYRCGSEAWLITPEPPALAKMLRAKVSRTHRGYLEYYGVDSVVVSGNKLCRGQMMRDGNRVMFGGKGMMFADSDTISVGNDVSTVIVCRGCTGRLRERLCGGGIDTVVISPSAHWRVGRTLSDSLQSVAVVSHRATILHRKSSDGVVVVQ